MSDDEVRPVRIIPQPKTNKGTISPSVSVTCWAPMPAEFERLHDELLDAVNAGDVVAVGNLTAFVTAAVQDHDARREQSHRASLRRSHDREGFQALAAWLVTRYENDKERWAAIGEMQDDFTTDRHRLYFDVEATKVVQEDRETAERCSVGRKGFQDYLTAARKKRRGG